MATITKLIEIKNPTKVKRQQWHHLQKSYSETCNWVLEQLMSGNTKLSSKDVPISLKSALKNEAIRQARKAYSDFKKGRAKMLPKFKPHMPVSINNQNWDFRQNDGRWYIGFTTNQGKVYLPIVERIEDSWIYHLGVRKKTNPLGTAKLLRKNRKWFIAIPVQISSELEIDYTAQTEIGVDLGLINLAVICEPKSNKRIFFSGKQVSFKRRKYRSLRKSLGKKKALRAIKAVGNKERRWMKDINHKISKAIVIFARQFPYPVIKLEDLSDIRNSGRTVKYSDRNLHNWAFYELQEFIKYKAMLAGIPVVEVEPKYTSQRCYQCGTVKKSNRQNQQYRCACSYTAHADLNASRNIAVTEPLTQAVRSRKPAA